MATLRVLHVKAGLDREMGGSVTAIVGVARTTTLSGDSATISALVAPADDLSLATEVSDGHSVQLKLVNRPKVSPFGISLGMWRALDQAVREYDLVEVHEVYSFPALAACFAARKHRVPYAIHPHNSLDPYDMRKRKLVKQLLRPVIRRVLRHAAALWFTTDEECERSDDHKSGVTKLVSPLSVAPSKFVGDAQRFRRRHQIAADAFVLLFLGRLDPKKGLPRTIDAFSASPVNNSWLIIAGSGDRAFAQLVRQAAAESSASDRILMPGYLRDQDFSDALAAADLFVLHSDNENFGLAPVEAALAGVPSLLSRDVFVASDLEKAGVAKVVDTTSEALCEALANLMSRGPDMARLSQAVGHARVPFSDEDVAQRDRAIRRIIVAKE